MAFTVLAAMVRKDLLLFFADRRSVIMAFAVPILVASFFGSVFSGSSSDAEPARIAIAVVDQDGSTISRAIVTGLQGDRNLKVALPPEDEARASVKRGRTSVAAIIPAGFGDAAGQAFFGSAPKPALDLLYDPSRSAEVAMVRGILTEHVMQAVSREMFGGAQGRQYVERMLPQIEASQSLPPDQKRLLTEMLRSVKDFYNRPNQTAEAAGPGLSMPYTVREQAMTANATAGRTSGRRYPAWINYASQFDGHVRLFVGDRIRRLEELLERSDTLPIRDGFEPSTWTLEGSPSGARTKFAVSPEGKRTVMLECLVADDRYAVGEQAAWPPGMAKIRLDARTWKRID